MAYPLAFCGARGVGWQKNIHGNCAGAIGRHDNQIKRISHVLIRQRKLLFAHWRHHKASESSGRYSNTVTYTYDAAGRKSSESLTVSGQTYTSTTEYDAAGRVSKLIYPDASEVTRSYTKRGQLHELAVNLTTIDTRGYDDGGRLTSSSYNNGVSESRTYNDDGTLAGIAFSGASIGDYSYTWDANKNKTSESITGVMSDYGFSVGASGYDAEDRLVNWQRSDANLDQAWDLTPVGDWDTFTENASVQDRTHGPAHELLTVESQSVQHDAKGNMTLIPAVVRPGGDPLRMAWDFDNRLASADTDNDGIDDVFYRFDALGRRIGRDDGTDNVVYFQNRQQTLADYPAGAAAGSPTYTYVYASYIDEPVLRTDESGNKLYYHRNQQYSITALTGMSGAIIERYAYDAYGQPTITDGSGTALTASIVDNRYTYTGREWDKELHLYHFRARMYDAVLGRFASRDPLGFGLLNANAYQFLGSHPLSRLDPSGNNECSPGDCMIMAATYNVSGMKLQGYFGKSGWQDIIDLEGATDIFEEDDWIETIEEYSEALLRRIRKEVARRLKRIGENLLPGQKVNDLWISAFRVCASYEAEYEVRCCGCDSWINWNYPNGEAEGVAACRRHGIPPLNVLDELDREEAIRHLKRVVQLFYQAFDSGEVDREVKRDIEKDATGGDIGCCKNIVGWGEGAFGTHPGW